MPSGEDAVDNANAVVTYRMFNCREHLTQLDNVEHLYFKNHKDARSTFARTGLTVLNISKLDLNNITGQADYLFNESPNLTTIYVNPSLITNNTFATKYAGAQMFLKTPNLVGQNGYKWKNDNDHMTGKNACVNIDDDHPGYFSVLPNT